MALEGEKELRAWSVSQGTDRQTEEREGRAVVEGMPGAKASKGWHGSNVSNC